MPSTSNIPVSSYLDYLPAVLQKDPFLGQFLLAFEAILSGISVESVSTPVGFEQTLTNIHTKFALATTSSDFLPWLAGWVALSLRDDWDDKVKRDFIQRIVPLYRQRGTKSALKKMLQIYLQKQVELTDKSSMEYVEIFEFDQIPYYFQVQLRVDNRDLAERNRKETIARAIIEQEKPAHTIYSLQILMPTMRLASAKLLATESLIEAAISEELSKEQEQGKIITKEEIKKNEETMKRIRKEIESKIPEEMKKENIKNEQLKLCNDPQSEENRTKYPNKTSLGTL